MHVALIFLAAFVFVALKAIQQRQVAHDEYSRILPTSISMGLVEVYLIATIGREGWSLPMALSWGVGAGLGCLTAMWAHRRFSLKGKQVQVA